MRNLALAAAALLLAACQGSSPSGFDPGPPACDLDVPARLELGPVPPAIPVRGEVIVRNRGATPCSLGAPALDACDGFVLESPAAPVTLPATSEVSFAVRLEPGAPGPVDCALRFDAGPDARSVHLLGLRDAGCLAVTPAFLDLGSLVAGCGFLEDDVEVTNRCAVEVVLASADVVGDGFLVQPGPLPRPVPPGGTTALLAHWRPEGIGEAEGILVLDFEPAGIAPLRVDVAGLGTLPPKVIDTLEQVPPVPVDHLVVVDNGVATGPFADAVIRELGQLRSFLAAQHLDYRLAVTTTGLVAEPAAGCPGGVGGGEDGRFFPVDRSRPRIVTPDTPDGGGFFAANLAVGSCRTGPSQAFEAALRAVRSPLVDADDDSRHPEPADGNAGFLRADAKLSIWLVGARDDGSPLPVDEYLENLRHVKRGRDDLLAVHAIAGDPGTGCSTAAPGDRLVGLVEATGGRFRSICEESWEAMIGEAAAVSFDFETCFFLTERAADPDGDGQLLEESGELAVRLDGRPLPSVEAGGARVWQYSPEQHAVCFFPSFVPVPGSVVEIEYFRHACP